MSIRRSRIISLCLVCLLCVSAALGAEKEYTNSVGMKMVGIKAGRFVMGQERGTDLPLSLTYGHRFFLGGEVDEHPLHWVSISKDFYMAATEVTNAQYEQFDPSHKKLRGKMGLSKGDNEAVVCVSWNDAVNYCKWLSDKEGRTYRLPTEAEWEYACRAGTTTIFNTGDTLPEIYQKSPRHRPEPDAVSTVVGQTPANAWGLHDMHGNVEEWCSDWYGPYEAWEQTDPVGRKSGIWRVVRGGSHNVYIKSLRSANRLSNLAEDKHWLLGFRVVQAEAPATKPLKAEKAHRYGQKVSQKKFDWEANKKSGPYFAEPLKFVLKPEDPAKEKFLFHNHVPTVAWCDNGDILAAWFSCARERSRELGIVATRFRRNTEKWDTASKFFNARDRNMHGTGLFNLGDGRLVHLNGLGTDGWWSKLAMTRRYSSDNGATWTQPELVDPVHGKYIAHMGISRLKDGKIIFPCDGHGGTGLYMSPDNGESWEIITSDADNGSIMGSHAGAAQLDDGSIYALGRGKSIDGKMPVSHSFDGGKTWKYYASPFPRVSGGQRPILMKLNEGALFAVGFTDNADYQKVEINRPRPRMMGKNGIIVKDAAGKDRKVYGMFAAVSLDDGKTWPYIKPVSDFGTGKRLNGEGWTQNFIMDEIRSEPLGYLACMQSPDNIIHLMSSGQHYQFNLDWVKEPMPAASGKAMTFFAGEKYPANNGLENQPGVMTMEFIYDDVPFPQCHASTIEETEDGLVAAWFGGTREKNPDVGIWVSRLTGEGWSQPVEVADGVESPTKRYPCWNPVLFQPWEGPLILFYKVGPSPKRWWGVMKTSDDCGRTWSEAKLLPEGFVGPIKNKPIELQDETILCPSSSEDHGWRVHFEKFWYKTGKWEMIGPINDGKDFGAIQPSILMYFRDSLTNDRMQILCRTGKQRVVSQSWSSDRGKTWSEMKATSLPNPNAGTDAVTLTNGMQLIVYNHTTRKTEPRSREFLNVAVSKDGEQWEAALVLENTDDSEFSYPAVIQTADDLVHIVYTWKRQRVKHVVVDPSKLVTKPIVDGKWPM